MLVKQLIQERLIDYAAMDIKNSPEHYNKTSGVNAPMDSIRQTVSILLEGSIPYEFRTTVVKELHSHEDFIEIGRWIHGASQYYLQSFEESDHIICPDTYHCWDANTMNEFLEILRPHVDYAALRGMN